MRLTEYLDTRFALTGLSGTDLSTVVHALSTFIAERIEGLGTQDLERALLDREKVHTTTLGRGVAIPHATIEGVDRPVLLLARADEPVQFGPPDTDPVSLFFVLVSPPGREGEHIKLLARICRLVRTSGFEENLRKADTAEQLVEMIARMDAEHV